MLKDNYGAFTNQSSEQTGIRTAWNQNEECINQNKLVILVVRIRIRMSFIAIDVFILSQNQNQNELDCFKLLKSP